MSGGHFDPGQAYPGYIADQLMFLTPVHRAIELRSFIIDSSAGLPIHATVSNHNHRTVNRAAGMQSSRHKTHAGSVETRHALSLGGVS